MYTEITPEPLYCLFNMEIYSDLQEWQHCHVTMSFPIKNGWIWQGTEIWNTKCGKEKTTMLYNHCRRCALYTLPRMVQNGHTVNLLTNIQRNMSEVYCDWESASPSIPSSIALKKAAPKPFDDTENTKITDTVCALMCWCGRECWSVCVCRCFNSRFSLLEIQPPAFFVKI